MRAIKLFFYGSSLTLLALCLFLFKTTGDVYYLGWSLWGVGCFVVTSFLPAGHHSRG